MKTSGFERVGIDCRSIRRGPAGVATYVRNLLENLPCLECVDFSRPANNFWWNQLRIPPLQLRRQWNLYHAPSYTAPLVNFCSLVLSVHDLSYLAHPEWYPHQSTLFRRWYYRESLRRADRILVPTRATHNEVIRLFPQLENRIRLIPLGVSSFFQPDPELGERVRKSLELPPRFLLHVGDLHVRRNLPLLESAARLAGLPLVLVGKVLTGGERYGNWPGLLSDLSPEDLKGVYNAAHIFVYASKYEGFGLPLLEAMACGLPVVAARCSCIPEVVGEGALLVEPDPEEFASAFEVVERDRESWVEKGLRRAAEFPWERTAQATLQAYRELS